jgi:hypothetical protein
MKPAVRMQSLQRKHFHAFWTALTRFLPVVRDDKQEIRFLFDFRVPPGVARDGVSG